MLDVKGSINNLKTTTEEHFKYIQQQRSFTRAFPIHFELAYTDFRVIEVALQLTSEQNHALLASFAAAYESVYQYEDAYATGGLEGFNNQFADKLTDYQRAKDNFLAIIEQITKLQP
ncbi:hypothetical protein OXT66_07555 [Lentilactobacillus senioris]|uniref:hypothetical protein n=1 Tax=Lentilactobacillus senioris TaxID=931534 RepID=UPI00227E3294|nr:hypothetical protein [Lentilactobacillus senioris]MCY9807387.1 hypothetical protein [Lentilactobacillus senioris]